MGREYYDSEGKLLYRTAGTARNIPVDGALSSTSTNPVQNKVITEKLAILGDTNISAIDPTITGAIYKLNNNLTPKGVIQDLVVFLGEGYGGRAVGFVPFLNADKYTITLNEVLVYSGTTSINITSLFRLGTFSYCGMRLNSSDNSSSTYIGKACFVKITVS